MDPNKGYPEYRKPPSDNRTSEDSLALLQMHLCRNALAQPTLARFGMSRTLCHVFRASGLEFSKLSSLCGFPASTRSLNPKSRETQKLYAFTPRISGP